MRGLTILIPAFTISGVLPPFLGDSPTHRAAISPYGVSVSALIGRFATSPERVGLLRGLLDYRAALTGAGISAGMQWIAGSFVEDCEQTRGRAPGDIDIVTFAHRHVKDAEAWAAFVAESQHLFDQAEVKRRFKADAYFVDLDVAPRLIVSDTSYWSGLFSHRRATGLWKGMLGLSLCCDDDRAREQLEAVKC